MSDVIDHWMKSLGNSADGLYITQFPLPGSHDAVSYGTINEKSKTQEKSIKEQLMAGFRYFDLRVRVDNGVFFGHHGADEVRDNQYAPNIFNDIKEFSEAHPEEIIILNFYDATSVWNQSFIDTDKMNFVNHLYEILGDKLAPTPQTYNPPTYGELKRKMKPIIAIITEENGWGLDGNFDATFCKTHCIWLASAWLDQRFSNYARLAGRSYEDLYELTAKDQEESMLNGSHAVKQGVPQGLGFKQDTMSGRDPNKFWVSQTILGYDNASTSDGHSANYWGAKNMNALWKPTFRRWFVGASWDGQTQRVDARPHIGPNILLIDYSGVFDTLPQDCSDLLTHYVPIGMHKAETPDRYYYDTQFVNNYGYSTGEIAFYAHAYRKDGADPVYKQVYKGSDRYYYYLESYYHSDKQNNLSYGPAQIAFYAFRENVKGTVPIYRQKAENPERFYYGQKELTTPEWSKPQVAFYAYAESNYPDDPGAALAGTPE